MAHLLTCAGTRRERSYPKSTGPCRAGRGPACAPRCSGSCPSPTVPRRGP